MERSLQGGRTKLNHIVESHMPVAERIETEISQGQFIHAVNLKLAALGCVPVESHTEEDFQQVARAILNHKGETRVDSNHLSPVDRRIQSFLDRYCGEDRAKLPRETFILDRSGLARELSIP